MSEQMEKNILKILEKVEKLEEGQKKLESGQRRLEWKLDKQEEFNNKIVEKLDKQEEFNNKIIEKFNDQEIFNMKILQSQENLRTELSEMKKEFTKLSNQFTAFEFDINRKVDVLLENYDFDHKHFIKYNQDIFNLKKQTFNHEGRISNLELKSAMP